MRTFSLVLAATALTACAGTSHPARVERMTMPVEILRAEGQAPRMGGVVLEAGGHEDTDRFSLSVYFESDGVVLGKPRQVSWSAKLGDYCKNRPSWTQAVLTGPSGQVWRGWRRNIPTGPDRDMGTLTGSTGATSHGGEATPGLLEAMADGGRFTVAFEDDEGRRWNETVIDTLLPARREQLFAVNRKLVSAADPAMPVRGQDMLPVVYMQPYVPPNPPRPCSGG